MSKIKGYNRRLMHFIEKNGICIMDSFILSWIHQKRKNFGRFLWKFCLVERFYIALPVKGTLLKQLEPETKNRLRNKRRLNL